MARIPVWNSPAQPEYSPDTVFDCFLAEYLLAPGEGEAQQEKTLKKYGVTTLRDLAEKQEKALRDAPKLFDLLFSIEQPLTPILLSMHKTGIQVDKQILQNLSVKLEQTIRSIEAAIARQAGVTVNLSSPAQVGSMLVAKFSVPLPKTASGQFATGERELTKLAPQYSILREILRFRAYMKTKTTYIDGLLLRIGTDDRIHTTYSQANTVTGRISSSNPNMQNIPSSRDPLLDVKSCFVASRGYRLVSFDYSQQELRILAHISGDEKLIEAFTRHKDIHVVTASTLFKVSEEKVEPFMRTIAKTINFGIIYGMGAFGLSQTLQIPIDEAERFIAQFYTSFPKIREYFNAMLTHAQTVGYCETLLGRRRILTQSKGKYMVTGQNRRELINFPIQGSAADCMKKAMVQLAHTNLTNSSSCRLLLSIHDELVFDIKDDRNTLEKTIETIRDCMQSVYPLVVPTEVSVKTGKTWSKMEDWN